MPICVVSNLGVGFSMCPCDRPVFMTPRLVMMTPATSCDIMTVTHLCDSWSAAAASVVVC